MIDVSYSTVVLVEDYGEKRFDRSPKIDLSQGQPNESRAINLKNEFVSVPWYGEIYY
jgi:hypothetical protein